MGQDILDCLKDKNYTTLYDLYGFMIFNEIAEELTDETKIAIDNTEKDFTELFNTTSETIYFRNSEIDNGLTERFNDNENNHIIAYINTEDSGDTNLDYNAGSSEELNKLMLKYNLTIEWENECIASLSFDEQID